MPELRITTAEAAKGRRDFRRISSGERETSIEAEIPSLFLKQTITGGLKWFWVKEEEEDGGSVLIKGFEEPQTKDGTIGFLSSLSLSLSLLLCCVPSTEQSQLRYLSRKGKYFRGQKVPLE